MLHSKAFSEAAMLEVLKFIEAQPPSPARARIRFIVRFFESVWLRTVELLNAKVENFLLEPECWVMQVYGKGAKTHMASVLGQIFDALQEYLAFSSVGLIQSAPPKTPLAASSLDPLASIV